jgi:glucose 1-dehydrogenase
MTAAPLHGQSALVTGASSGIGRAAALALARAGASVGINYRGSREPADEMVAQIAREGGKAVAVEADVSKEDRILSMFDRFVDAFGRIDILVANAGIQRDAPAPEMTAEQWREVLDVNLTGAFLCVREAVKRFLAQEPSPRSKAAGKVVCVSSVHEAIPWAGHVNYAASKAGLMMTMKTMAQELAAKKIRINAVAPGAIKTNINKETWSDPKKAAELCKLIPYGRIGEPEDVARAVVWLVSEESDYVTGATLFVDGGMALYPAFRWGG